MFMPGFLWSKKNIIFQKENGNTFTLLIIFIVKSLQKEQNGINLLLWPPICRNKPVITPKWFNSLDTNSTIYASLNKSMNQNRIWLLSDTVLHIHSATHTTGLYLALLGRRACAQGQRRVHCSGVSARAPALFSTCSAFLCYCLLLASRSWVERLKNWQIIWEVGIVSLRGHF